MKRLWEAAAAFFLLVLLAPCLLAIVLAIRIQLGSPVLFKQARSGRGGTPFFIYKFRTMTNEKNKDGQFLVDDLRLTALGRFLRKYSLDELPQLLNILKGEMSFVGPRPLLIEYMPLFEDWQLRRFLVKPGLTGWSQVNGRNAISWEEKFQLDVWYVENRSFFLDVRILLLTLFRMIRPRGVNEPGKATVHPFQGKQEDNQDQK